MQARKPNPLTDPPKQNWALYLPVALKEALQEDAVIDGYPSASSYAVEMLAAAITDRRAERAKEKK